jgi:hypothetical protein
MRHGRPQTHAMTTFALFYASHQFLGVRFRNHQHSLLHDAVPLSRVEGVGATRMPWTENAPREAAGESASCAAPGRKVQSYF